LNSDLVRINITNDSKWQCGPPFEDSIHYIMECPLHQNENFKVKCKGHNFFFQIYTFLDSDFSTLIEYRNNLKFSQDFCAKSLGKLTCLKPRKISIMVIPLKKYPVVTSFVSFFSFLWGQR
jgi:hypothetical protein